jgi:hypothetical protein
VAIGRAPPRGLVDTSRSQKPVRPSRCTSQIASTTPTLWCSEIVASYGAASIVICSPSGSVQVEAPAR